MKIKCNIADILHDAADKELAHNQQTYWACRSETRTANRERFSCCAIDNAVGNFLNKKYPQMHWRDMDCVRESIQKYIKKGLEAMGLNTESISAFGDESIEINSEIQGQRYFWLKFAALMAEEQGVVYETQAL